MMYLHFCKNCSQIFILNGHQQECIKCGELLTELKLSYMDYTNYSREQRAALINRLQNPEELKRSKKNYRFSKHTKRYQEWANRVGENSHNT